MRCALLVAVLTVACGGSSEVAVEVDDAGADVDDTRVDDVAPLGDADAIAEDVAPDAPAWEPEPIPAIDPEPPAPCPEADDSPDYFQFLDDVCHAKVWPSDLDRDFACPIVATSAPGFRASSEPVVVEDVLKGIVPDALRVTVIVIRRVGGVPRYRYLSNGTADDVFQPWSSTKFLAAANGGATLRKRSAYKVGLGASVDAIPLGDLITTIHNYDPDHYSSNGLARYFHDIGGRANANALIHDAWLGRPANETFGGNYGAAAPPLGFTFVEPGGAKVTITPDTSSGPANALSTRTLAEALKRLVMHREDEATRMPALQWADLRVLFHGASPSKWYTDPLGGMSADTAIYHQAAHDAAYIAKRSRGRFRNYSKLGFGSGQFVNVGYSCWPVLDPSGAPLPDAGDELVIATRLATGGASDRERDRIVARAYRAIVERLVARKL